MPKRFPPEVRERFVDLVCEGLPLRGAARATGVSSTQAVVWWRQCGHMSLRLAAGGRAGLGPVPTDVGERGRVRRALSLDDRVLIAVGVHQVWTLQRIADAIGRDRSVVCREVRRNRSPDGVYRVSVAHRAAAARRVRPRQTKLDANPDLCRLIESWMDDGWSPRLISEVLAVAAALDPDTVRVSHETIYQALYVQTRGSLRADLHRCLSLKRSRRRPRGSSRHSSSPYKEAFTISQRPAEVADRAMPGHWEGDLIMSGAGSTAAIGTLVERSTRFTILLHLPDGHDSAAVAEAMIREMSKLPEHLRRSVTWDRGTELARYAEVQTALELKLFFCDPHSPWQRGTNENTNRLLRHWFEKGSDLSIHTANDLARIAAKLNARPRPTLDLDTPAQRLNQLLLEAAA